MTRGQEASITNNNPSENVPNAILTLTKNVLGQNVTKTIEPMIKRFSVVETRDDPALLTASASPLSGHVIATTVTTTSATNATPFNDLSIVAHPTVSSTAIVDAKKKKTKSKIKRKDQLNAGSATATTAQQLSPISGAISENRKILIF
jgi:hypothetical protein